MMLVLLLCIVMKIAEISVGRPRPPPPPPPTCGGRRNRSSKRRRSYADPRCISRKRKDRKADPPRIENPSQADGGSSLERAEPISIQPFRVSLFALSRGEASRLSKVEDGIKLNDRAYILVSLLLRNKFRTFVTSHEMTPGRGIDVPLTDN